MSAADLVGNVSLFAGLAPADVAGILSISRRLAFAPGAALMRQGQPADGVFIVETGTADVLTALPGGGEAAVANVGPGSVLGEMALLEAGVRSATVVARTPMTGHWIERDGFRMLLAQRNAAVFTVQGRITLALCRRLRELNAKIVAREEATLLEFAKAEFERLYNGCERVNAKFRDAISRNLLDALAHTNNHLTRLVSQARIRRQGLPAAGEIDELERLLVTQDCEHC